MNQSKNQAVGVRMFRAFLNTLGNVIFFKLIVMRASEDHFDIEGVLASNIPFLNRSGAKALF